jgi:glycosyltransferase domain-containing protein
MEAQNPSAVPLSSATDRSSLLTVVIPTRNRPQFLARLLGYYSAEQFNHKLIIADSSDRDDQFRNGSIIKAVSKRLNIDYRVFDPLTEFTTKLHKAVGMVDTTYMAVGADDDFFVPSATNRALSFLDANPDYTIAHGESGVFVTESGLAHGEITELHRYGQRTIDSDTGVERLINHLNCYTTTFYSLHRTKQFRDCYRSMLNIKADLYFSELLHSCLSIVQGKAKKLHGLYLMRQGFAPKEYQVLDVFDWIASPGWGELYEKFRDCLAEELNHQEKIEIDRGRKIIKDVFSNYLATVLKPSRPTSAGSGNLRSMVRAVPGARQAWRTVQALNSKRRTEINLPALLDPSSAYHADFMPIYRAVVQPDKAFDHQASIRR